MLDILRGRRSIRRYKDARIDERIIEQLKEAALRSPSSRGINPWRFLFITDKEKLEVLSRAKESGSGFLKGAGLGVVVLGQDKESDVWIEDCSIASIILQLAGQSLGLGSCWIQIRNRMHNSSQSSEDYIREVLDLPKESRVECMIAFGYPDEIKEPHPRSELEYGKIIEE
ncbi:MAG TPA: nitroreductase family protein [Methanothrix sp.]|jgi:nitroreductase|uniref:nitroreductase family protein n=1 Tax=Methanothrix sp. TaxID=90426 RepID=UPI002C85AD94|nr:nitroreductase family protein [Euryarchaeota archaeon]HON37123.1 nitroreductase family protein [Methanothrix sp.]